MVKLFISDIDGCLSEPYHPYRLADFSTLAALVAEAVEAPSGPVPAFSLCSGRAYGYVEAMTQVLGVRVPVLFESGGGMFDPVTSEVTWNPLFSPQLAREQEEVKRWFEEECLPDTPLVYDYGKRTQAGIIGVETGAVAQLVPVVEQYVARRHEGLCVFHTPYSIDVLAKGITKGQAMGWLADVCGVHLDEVAYIGDSNGDLPALEAVGYSFAPANAAAVVRERVAHVTEKPLIEGVLEAYRWCVAHNRKHADAHRGG